MRTRFVIHKNLLSKVYKVIKRSDAIFGETKVKWFPEDIAVINPDRPVNEFGQPAFFVLPKSEYVPCDSKGNINVETAKVIERGTEQEGRSQIN